ncbi:glutathione S-transferase family protein [Pseudahrensia aquimaris]|uniref:Glutathione S-transferase family protein n=1 Tax=Pseudahrensia aquimaris TaxID=744461 RepID=A0ABW3FB57_9HYPH
MKLLTASASPFANKVRMAAQFAGIPLEAVAVDAGAQPPELLAANPLGKIPCLVLDDGTGLFDSRPITRYLHNRFDTALYPDEKSEAAMRVARYEALCDGICDCAVAYQYEKRMRPEENWHQPWLDRQWTKAKAGLREAATELPPTGEDADIRSIALSATLGYLALRFPGEWEAENPELVDWSSRFDAAHPSVSALKPSA